jgi:ribosomal protein S27AE
MTDYIRQLECLACSNSRVFSVHQETSRMLVSQADALALPRNAMITCGRCGSTSLVRGWGDGVPYATQGYVSRRRRRRKAGIVTAAVAALS